MKAEPMMKCARHWPRWSLWQKPWDAMPPKRNCTHVTTGIRPPSTPCILTNTQRILPMNPRSMCSLKTIPVATCATKKNINQFANPACAFFANCLPLCACPKKYPGMAITTPRICIGTCHRERIRPRTMPVGKIIPHATLCTNM